MRVGLDTDHLVEFDNGSARAEALMRRLQVSELPVATTIVSADEQLRGRLAEINRRRDPHRQIEPYARLGRRLQFFSDWELLP